MRRIWIAALLLVLIPATARATLDDTLYSDTDKVAFAFVKFGHFKPAYADMVKSSAAYDKADPVDKVELLRQNVPRLAAGYQQYDLDQDLIHVQADVKIVYVADPQVAKNGSASHKLLQLVFPGKDVSFPFSLGALWVNVVPADMQPVTTLPLSGNDYDTMTHILGGDGLNAMPAVVEIRLRPLGLDTNHPTTENGRPAWPMLAAVKQITVWDKTRQHIAWSMDATGYQSGDTKKLNDLYLK